MTRANSARRLFVELVAARADVRCSLSSLHGRIWAGETTQEGEEDEKERLSDNPPIRPRFARLISRARSRAYYTAANDLCVFGPLLFTENMKRFASATQKSYVVTTTFAKLESAKKREES